MDLYDNKNLKPMLLEEESKPFDNPNYIYELKLDGTRTLIFVEPDNILIKNRRDVILNNTYPELLNIKNIVKNKVIFDGEIILMDNGKPSFKKLQERALLKNKIKIEYQMKHNPVIFVCYDILYDNKDLTELPLLERKKILDKYPENEIFTKSKYIFEKGIELFKATKKQDLEGIVAKEIHSTYKIGKRSKDWIKIKNLKDEDFYIGGYVEYEDKVMASLLIGRKENNKLIYVGNVNIGKRNREFDIIKKNKILDKSPFEDFNDNEYSYIEPNSKCTVLFMEKTENNHLRQPIFKGLKLDE